MIPLSVLDLSPVTTATPGSAALHNSLDLARLADRLGYKRYWVAEHHNLANIASSMIGQIAAATSHLRVGSGGVMLPNHAPLMVAERFKVLEALFPGRIDLGLGRAPGTDPVTSYALRARQDPRQGDDFLERFQELLLLERGGFRTKLACSDGSAGDLHGCHSAGAGSGAASAGWLLERQCHVVDARGRSNRRQLHGGR